MISTDNVTKRLLILSLHMKSHIRVGVSARLPHSINRKSVKSMPKYLISQRKHEVAKPKLPKKILLKPMHENSRKKNYQKSIYIFLYCFSLRTPGRRAFGISSMTIPMMTTMMMTMMNLHSRTVKCAIIKIVIWFCLVNRNVGVIGNLNRFHNLPMHNTYSCAVNSMCICANNGNGTYTYKINCNDVWFHKFTGEHFFFSISFLFSSTSILAHSFSPFFSNLINETAEK